MTTHVSKKRKRSDSEVSETILVAEYHAQAHRDGLRSFFERGEFTDVVVRCSGAEIKAHKVILATHSKVLANKFRRWNQSAEFRDRVDMDGEDPQLVAAFLDYAYKCGYDATDKSDNSTKTSLMPIQYHVRVFAFAVKYEMEGLRDLAADKFDALAAGAWETLAFSRAVQEIYAMTHPSERDLRMIVFRLACEHADVLLDRLDFQAALMVHGELANFSRAVAKRMHETVIGQWQPDWTCRNCTHTFEAASLPSFCISCGTPNPHRYPWGGLLSTRPAK